MFFSEDFCLGQWKGTLINLNRTKMGFLLGNRGYLQETMEKLAHQVWEGWGQAGMPGAQKAGVLHIEGPCVSTQGSFSQEQTFHWHIWIQF